jgi:hypothetical protein
LKDQLQAGALWRASKATGWYGSNVLPAKADRSARRVKQACHDAYERGFPAPGFTHQADTFTREDGEGNVIDGPDNLGQRRG